MRGLKLCLGCSCIAVVAVRMTLRLDSRRISFAGERNVDINKVVEHAVTGAGVGLLFLGIGLVWQGLNYLYRKLFAANTHEVKAKPANSPDPQETRKAREADASARAIAAARRIVEQSKGRDSVSPENRQYYDFILSAAKAVIDDPRLAGRVGAKMAPWG